MTAKEYLLTNKKQVDTFLDKILVPEDVKPESIHKAIRYSVLSGGKRFRSSLCNASYETLVKKKGERVDKDIILPVMGAIELIHTYSLIHDDLPCMDDDDFRRGKPTLHHRFTEGIAVLTGDALNAIAFGLLTKAGRLELINILADAIGTLGMIGGQVADVEAEGREVTEDEVEYIHSHKTASLISASCRMGGFVAGGNKDELEILGKYGTHVGLAFQIVDDILDVVGDENVIGKDVGSDQENQKASYPSVTGMERSQDMARKHIDMAIDSLDELSCDVETLRTLAFFVIQRKY